MRTRVRKWGNSLAVRISKSFATETGIEVDSPVELTLVDGGMLIRPIQQKPASLEELLSGVTEENLHGEWDTGPAVGRESW